MTRSLPFLAALALGVGMAGGALFTDALLARTGPPTPAAARAADPGLARPAGHAVRPNPARVQPRVWTPAHTGTSRR